MRMIGHVNGEAQARAFSDFLLVQGIESQVEADRDGQWMVWIQEEDQLERAKQLLAEFLRNPTDAKYSATAGKAGQLKEQKKQEQTAYEKRLKKRRHLFSNLKPYAFGPVTFLLIFFCTAVFVTWQVKYGGDMKVMRPFFITDVNEHFGFYTKGLPEIRNGEIWRLITPIFIHFGVLHIFFNLSCLRDFGSMIEDRQNSGVLLALVVVFAAGSNYAQYLVSGPSFGGMSGVIYGLMGYIWIRGKFDPGSGLYLHRTTVTMMIVWFFVCLIGLMGNIANTAHGAGLVMGMAWGYLSSLRYR